MYNNMKTKKRSRQIGRFHRVKADTDTHEYPSATIIGMNVSSCIISRRKLFPFISEVLELQKAVVLEL